MSRIPLSLCIAVLTAGIFAGLPGAYAQEEIVVLKPLPSIPHAGWSRVMVWDDRPDTTRIGKEKDGTIIRFNTTTSRAIAHCIQAAVGPNPARNRAILIDVKQLAVELASEGRRSLLFSADIYVKKNDSLWLKISSYRRSRYFGFSIASAMGTLFSGVIGAIDVGLTVTKDTGAVVLRRGQGAGGIAAAPRMDYPILRRQEVTAAGCYHSFYDFRNDSLVRCPYRIKLVMDSLYTLLVNDLPAKAADELVDGIWAYADTAGNLYIRILGNRFVALTGKDDGFWFYLPRALPDMYSIQRMKDRIKNFDPNALDQQFSYSGGGNWLTIPLAIVMLLTVDVTLNGSAALINQAKVKKIERAGIRSGNFRDCRLNMENGEIEY
jgi:hypothetical protein